MRNTENLKRGLLLVLLVASGCAGKAPVTGPILETVPVGRLAWSGSTPVLHLVGSPYEIGYQHGSLMRGSVQASVTNILKFADGQLGVPGVGRFVARRLLDRTWRRMKPFVPDDALEEMEGLSDGARIPLRLLQRVHAVPELTSVSCASFAAWGSATRDSRLIQIRNLDWAIQSDVQRYAALFVIHPKGRHAYVNIGWLGFIGVISGISERGISVAEVGAESVDQSFEGIPMPFLLRRILREADDLEQAVDWVRTGPRTVGFNYLFADAQKRRAVALETNRNRCAVFWMDEQANNPYGIRAKDALFRGDWALNPDVRDRQTACKGDPEKPGLESPRGSGAYDTRYLGVGLLLDRFHGAVDLEVAMAIAAAVAAKNNIQSIVYAWPELWVSTAQGRQRASESRYRGFDLPALFTAGSAEETSR